DSILTIPATRIERSRLIRWRMNWLPGRKKPCPCNQDDDTTTNRKHFHICPLIPQSLCGQLPESNPNDSLRHDFAISSSLSDASKPPPPFWTALLLILESIEILGPPGIDFPKENAPEETWQYKS
ncbi:hypothetical protein BC943DRAFT_264562, partial [Umbelopsis sp. AD052]